MNLVGCGLTVVIDQSNLIVAHKPGLYQLRAREVAAGVPTGGAECAGG
jgi:hypothetical protein